jgi:parallel beta helix pectate lyase-like protein
VTSRKMWGDGFYVEDATNTKFCAVTADSNRRQGLSIVEADDVLVTDSVFKNTHGTRPSAGIDLEPDNESQKITNVRIQNSKFLDNVGPGIEIAGEEGRRGEGRARAQCVQRQSPHSSRECSCGSCLGNLR